MPAYSPVPSSLSYSTAPSSPACSPAPSVFANSTAPILVNSPALSPRVALLIERLPRLVTQYAANWLYHVATNAAAENKETELARSAEEFVLLSYVLDHGKLAETLKEQLAGSLLSALPCDMPTHVRVVDAFKERLRKPAEEKKKRKMPTSSAMKREATSESSSDAASSASASSSGSRASSKAFSVSRAPSTASRASSSGSRAASSSSSRASYSSASSSSSHALHHYNPSPSRGGCVDSPSERLIWIDCEMTGLEPDRHALVEIAIIVTDANLEIIAEGPSIEIYQPDDVLAGMSDWCRRTFAVNGLTERVRRSTISLRLAEELVLAFLARHTPAGRCLLAGNSVWMDRLFLRRQMPRVDAHLHYSSVDVTPIREVGRRWFRAETAAAPRKANTHRALDDIKESIEELRYYRSHLFKAAH